MRVCDLVNEIGLDNYLDMPDYAVAIYIKHNLQELFQLSKEKEKHDTFTKETELNGF